jgi:pimeloyl-ACP methyl ester carboxylesterase
MLDDFDTAEIETGDVRIFVRWSGAGSPLLLLHGFPQTHLMWRRVAPLLAAGVSRVVAIFGVQGWRWEWAREVCELVFALDADAAGQQQWRQLARQAALRGKRVAVLPPGAYGGCKDVSDAWATGVLAVEAGPAAAPGGAALAVPPHQRESWTERVAIMVIDGGLPREDAERLAWVGLQTPDAAP